MNNTPPVDVTAETITPDRARELLKANRNRRLRPRHIDYLANELTMGRWELTNDAVMLAADGTLINGQHRLLAIVKADKPAPLLVLHGATLDAQMASDTGNRRTLRDALELAGFTDLINTAAVVTFLFRMYDPELSYPQTRQRKYAFQPQVEFAKANAEKLQTAVHWGNHVRQAVRFPGSIVGGLWYLQDDIDPADAAGFWNGIVDLVALDETDPRLVWRKWADRQATTRMSSSYMPEHHKVAIAIKAWNLWRDGLTVQMLVYRAGGVGAERFPDLR